jgi:sirohydrochlorin cobaltochelatase
MDLTTTRATILFAHGSRDPLWRQPIEAVAERIQALQPAALVRCAYLELTEPDLPTSAAELVGLGATALTVVPMFLGVGRHAREDLPELMAQLQAAHPQINFVLKPAIGEHPQMTALMAEIAVG